MGTNTESNPTRRRVLDNFPLKEDRAETEVPFRSIVEFRRGKKKDDYVAFPYSQLVWLNYYPSYGIIAHFASHTVHVLGTSLERVYEGLRDQTTRKVHLSDPVETPQGVATVTDIFIVPKSSSDPGFTRFDVKELAGKDA